MAKRRRLSPAQTDYLSSQTLGLETKSMPLGPAPIAQVAGEASASAALQELAGEMARAREEGRLILTLDLEAIEVGYLVRDRLAADDEDLVALAESLRARGQQTPVEVVALEEGRFGLISGWRRLTALRRLAEETGDPRFTRVKALLRRPETAADAYVAMVEENEIRVGLSYYERARVAAKAVEQGVFPDQPTALRQLYAAASRAKRSKIGSFLSLYHAADDLLRFPAAIGERLGLALAKALDEGGDAARTALRQALSAAGAEGAEAEQAALKGFLTPPSAPRRRAGDPGEGGQQEVPDERPTLVAPLTPGLFVSMGENSLTLTGPSLNQEFRRRLLDWIRRNGS